MTIDLYPPGFFDRTLEIVVGRWRSILELMGIDPVYLGPSAGSCPRCGGREVFLFEDAAGTGSFICAAGNTPVVGDGFELLRHVHGWSYSGALKRVTGLVGLTNAARLPRTPEFQTKAEAEAAALARRKQALMVKLWSGARPIVDGDPAAGYLTAHGLVLATYPAALRYHPSLPYWSSDETTSALEPFPAMLATITDHLGRWVGLHATYLVEGIRHPITGEPLPLKQAMPIADGICDGAAVRLADPTADGRLVVAEAIETALAAGLLSDLPAWACLDAAGLRALQLRSPIRDVLIAANNDFATSQGAARTLSTFLRLEGMATRVKWPDEPGTSWLDVLNGAPGSLAEPIEGVGQ